MKKFIGSSARLIVIVISFSFHNLCSQESGQNTYMVVMGAPKYVIQINGTYDRSMLELSGTYNSDFHSELVTKGETFGTHYGFGAGVTSKVSLEEHSNFWFTQSLSYHRIQSYFLEDKSTNMDKGKTGYNCFTGGLGMEYNFTPNYSVKIYAGGELTGSLISGYMEIWYPNRGLPYVEKYDVSNSFRMGYAFTAGGAYMVSKRVGVNFNLKFNNLNSFFKNTGGSSTDKEFTLRDGSSETGVLFAGHKNFSFYSFGAGVSFYFGISEKRYKLN